ncbi:MAG: hypothetical protein FIB06_00245 [Betaproteobacteria bacterium]|nr:hypothetical protein [Betaproteobacteria bacterium]
MSPLRVFGIALFCVLLAGCAGRGIPLPEKAGEEPAARAILLASAEAHGLAAWQGISDVSVAYAGEWHGLVTRLQPTLIDAQFRQGSEERLLLAPEPLLAQAHRGSGGEKQVVRSPAAITVAYNGQPASDKDVLAAAALVADGYRMFLTGPFYFLNGNGVLATAGSEMVDGRECDVLLAVRRPGHGLSVEDRYLLYIDREQRWLRRVRFTMEGLASTQGAVAEVDFFDHRRIAGVIWPARFFERLKKPIPNLSVHNWRLVGLDVNRGLTAAELTGPAFAGKASAAARRLEGQ